MITARSTKAQLITHIASLDAQLLAAGRTVAALREVKAMAAQPTADFVAPPAMHKAYYQFINAQRVIARAAGKRVVSYQTFPQWVNGMRHTAGVPA